MAPALHCVLASSLDRKQRQVFAPVLDVLLAFAEPLPVALAPHCVLASSLDRKWTQVSAHHLAALVAV